MDAETTSASGTASIKRGDDGGHPAGSDRKRRVIKSSRQQPIGTPQRMTGRNDHQGAAETGSGSTGRARPTISSARSTRGPAETVTDEHVAWCVRSGNVTPRDHPSAATR